MPVLFHNGQRPDSPAMIVSKFRFVLEMHWSVHCAIRVDISKHSHVLLRCATGRYRGPSIKTTSWKITNGWLLHGSQCSKVICTTGSAAQSLWMKKSSRFRKYLRYRPTVGTFMFSIPNDIIWTFYLARFMFNTVSLIEHGICRWPGLHLSKSKSTSKTCSAGQCKNK